MKKVIFIVLASAFMMPSYHVYAAQAGAGEGEGGGDVHAAAQAKELGQLLIQVIKEGADNLEEQVRQLIADGSDVDAQDGHGNTALMHASSLDRPEIVEMLLNAGADVNSRNFFYESTALMCAAENGRANIVEILLNRGADVNAQDGYGNTALVYAAMYGFLDVVQMLLEYGANVDAQTQSGKTALMIASELKEILKGPRYDPNANLQIVEKLLAAHPDVDLKDEWYRTAFSIAIRQLKYMHDMLEMYDDDDVKNAQIVKMLFEHQAGRQDSAIEEMVIDLQRLTDQNDVNGIQRLKNRLIEYILTYYSDDNLIRHLILILSIWDNSAFMKELLKELIQSDEKLEKAYKNDVDNLVNDRKPAYVLLEKLIQLQKNIQSLGIGLK